MRVALHSHTRHGSFDGALPPSRVIDAYKARGFGAVAITDHDTVTDVPHRDDMIVFRGVEHTLDGWGHHHLVELVDHDFRMLPHPGDTFPDTTEDEIRRHVDEYGIDAVEKFNTGRRQYQGWLDIEGLAEVAADDAHNAWQMAQSWIEVGPWVSTASGVIEAIKSGNFTIHSEPSRTRETVGHAVKGVSYALSSAQRQTRRRSVTPEKETKFYHPRAHRRPRSEAISYHEPADWG